MIPCPLIAVALATAAPGSTVATGAITCPDRISISDRDYGGVTLDASGATFLEGAGIRDVKGLTIKGGTWGRTDRGTIVPHTIRADNVEDFSLANATVVGNGDEKGNGVSIRAFKRATVRDSYFSGHQQAIAFYGGEDLLATRNVIEKATSDGINLADNQRGIVSANSCAWYERSGRQHPDCIQLWSGKGKPLQADIWVINNKATGVMQGILSSDPKTGSGRRLHFHGNYMAVTFSHTITCGACVESVATDNVLASYPGTLYGIGKLKGFEDPSNVTARNEMRDGTKKLPPRVWWRGVPDVDGQVGSRFDNRSFAPRPGDLKDVPALPR
ncbi:right-handed parallel beta-helix repeat-containing protein [Sandarakinorhabdus oryzae]|uniref:right-handed parallel beta-helix repeat-containing protein n=1 Tax=Sandarakinorhabdus oryzae TaxID=2675220 RepID=UPI0012E221C0|nr:right-handed parallel beta-helix repeat-containing protein [Sandarakinorhabdus oryzae]